MFFYLILILSASIGGRILYKHRYHNLEPMSMIALMICCVLTVVSLLATVHFYALVGIILCVMLIMIYRLRSSHKKRKARRLMRVFILVAFGTVFGLVTSQSSGCQWQKRTRLYQQNARHLAVSQMEILGRHIRTHHPFANILLVVSPSDKLLDVRIQALKRGLDKRGKIMAQVTPEGWNEKDPTMSLRYHYRVQQLDTLVEAHAPVDVLLSLIPLPAHMDSSRTINLEESPKLFLVSHNPADLKLIESETPVSVVVAPRTLPAPKSGLPDRVSGESDVVFEEYFIMRERSPD